MAVRGIDYIPNVITIQKDVPVEWRIDGSGATGCTAIIAIPSLNISERLSFSKETVINFTVKKSGIIPFTCGMGMAYGEFHVVDNLNSNDTVECDADIQSCDLK